MDAQQDPTPSPSLGPGPIPPDLADPNPTANPTNPTANPSEEDEKEGEGGVEGVLEPVEVDIESGGGAAESRDGEQESEREQERESEREREKSSVEERVSGYFASPEKNPWHTRSRRLHIPHLVLFVIMFPIAVVRIVLILLLLFIFIAILGVVQIGTDHARPLSPGRKRIIDACRFMPRLVLFLYGFLWITVHGTNRARARLPIHQHNDKENKESKNTREATLIVANHVSFFDIVYFMADCMPSFVSKAGVGRVPVLGIVARGLKCIFVDREQHTGGGGSTTTGASVLAPASPATPSSAGSPSSTSGATQALLSRVLDPDAARNPPVVIFPEGTTSNGAQLVRFHRGAFLAGVPVQPVVLKYKFWFADPSFTDVPAHKLALRIVFSPFSRLEVTYLPVHVPTTAETQNAQLYADTVQAHMAHQLDVPITDDSLSHKFAYLRRAAKEHKLPCC